jgi:hypothetical protein
MLQADGRFDLDLLTFVQHPQQFELEIGETIPKYEPHGDLEAKFAHRQGWFQVYNQTDGIYRTLLFAKERGRDVQLEAIGAAGIKVTTPEYTDYLFLHNDPVDERQDDVRFIGRVGWIRREAGGALRAFVQDGDMIAAFGHEFIGRGPWGYNLDGTGQMQAEGTPRGVQVRTGAP